MQRSLLGLRLNRFTRWSRQRRVQNFATLGLVLLGPVLALLTFVVLGPLDLGVAEPSLRVVLLADLVYVLVVAALVLQRVAQMVSARRNKSAGSQLHLRLTGVFALLALIPTILVAVFAVLSINVGLEGWFSDRVRNVVSSSLSAAQAYENEHKSELRRDAEALAAYLDTQRQQIFFMSDGEIRQALAAVSGQIDRSLTEAFVIDGGGELKARGVGSYEFDYEPPTVEQIAQSVTEMVIIEDWPNNEFRALIALPSFADRYLYVSREVDGAILSLLDETKETVGLYEQLESERGRMLFEFGLLYLGFAVILILAAIWLGLWFAERLSRPIGRLVVASERVGRGDFDVRVVEEDGDDEISQIGRHFNEMTERLHVQREELLSNTAQIDRRRRLFDSVLTSITSGVVGLDSEGRVTFVNRSGQRLLDVAEGYEETALKVAVPEFGPLFDALIEGKEVVQEQVNLVRGGKQEALLVRMATRRNEAGVLEGFVVAFDDVTDLVSAQRTAAWGDVARRIAHEIKNPLTPIQLSAERIQRKFAAKVGDDSEALEQMTNVIVRQTNDLRRIVDEFSKFARMPEPQKLHHDIAVLVKDAVALQQAGQPDVTISLHIEDGSFSADLDATMIGQALTNLIKNAGEATETYREKHPENRTYKGAIKVALIKDGEFARLTISDNGIGLPEDRARLFEPYVTTRDKGTGLGLPIVKKIIEEHSGSLRLEDADPFDAGAHKGAMAVVELPLLGSAADKDAV